MMIIWMIYSCLLLGDGVSLHYPQVWTVIFIQVLLQMTNVCFNIMMSIWMKGFFSGFW